MTAIIVDADGRTFSRWAVKLAPRYDVKPHDFDQHCPCIDCCFSRDEEEFWERVEAARRRGANNLASSADHDTKLALLRCSLQASVPLHMERFRTVPWKILQKRSQECVDIITSEGDNILYRSKKKGGTARAFNALAEAVAIMAYAPGGVKVFGLHFEAGGAIENWGKS